MKIKPYYILLKWNMKHPENKNRTSLYEIWEEYWDDYKLKTHNFNSVLYEVIEFHDSLSEAREHKRRLLNG